MNPLNLGRYLLCYLGCLSIYNTADGIDDIKEIIKISSDNEVCNNEDSEQPAEMVCEDEDHVIHPVNVSYKACNESPCIRKYVPVDKWPTGVLQCLGKFECKVLPFKPTPEFRVCASCSRSVLAPVYGLMHLFCNGAGDVINIKTSVSWSWNITPQNVHISDNSEGSRLAALKHYCDGKQYCNSINARPEKGNCERLFYKCVENITTTTFHAIMAVHDTPTLPSWMKPLFITLGIVVTALVVGGIIGGVIMRRKWHTSNHRNREVGANHMIQEEGNIPLTEHTEQ